MYGQTYCKAGYVPCQVFQVPCDVGIGWNPSFMWLAMAVLLGPNLTLAGTAPGGEPGHVGTLAIGPG
jgi:hypothetical protein